MATQHIISERAQLLLKALVGRYIREGQPISSRALARDTGMDISAATVRNVLADLEDLNLITSPHVSAGRIPTVQGYRFFVDSLITIQSLGQGEVETFKQQLDPSKDTQGLLETASSLLSEVTQLASVVMLPRREHVTLRQVEFLPLSEQRVLVILVTNERDVQNRIIQTERQYSANELQQVANYLNAGFAGQDVYSVRDNLLKDLHETREHINQLMLMAVEMTEKGFPSVPQAGECLVGGQANLLNLPEMSSVDKLRQLFEAFNHRRDILHLLDQCISARGVQIFIGAESGHESLQEYSVVTSAYEADGKVVGVLGVVGPTRMVYERIIPVVDTTAKLLSAALNLA